MQSRAVVLVNRIQIQCGRCVWRSQHLQIETGSRVVGQRRREVHRMESMTRLIRKIVNSRQFRFFLSGAWEKLFETIFFRASRFNCSLNINYIVHRDWMCTQKLLIRKKDPRKQHSAIDDSRNHHSTEDNSSTPAGEVRARCLSATLNDSVLARCAIKCELMRLEVGENVLETAERRLVLNETVIVADSHSLRCY